MYEELDLSDGSVYFKVWGIDNLAPYFKCPYDVVNNCLLTDYEFLKEDEFIISKTSF